MVWTYHKGASAKQHYDEYKALSNEAYSNLQNYLKSRGVITVDEWLKSVQKDLTSEEAAVVQKVRCRSVIRTIRETEISCQTLADMEPAQGLSALKQPTEIAKFIAGCYIGKLTGILYDSRLTLRFSQRCFTNLPSGCTKRKGLVLQYVLSKWGTKPSVNLWRTTV